MFYHAKYIFFCKVYNNSMYIYIYMEFFHTVAEYVWLGGNNEFRSKSRVFNEEIRSLDQLPKWNYDGSSTEQADGTDSEVILVPRQLFSDPVRGGNSILVLCEKLIKFIYNFVYVESLVDDLRV